MPIGVPRIIYCWGEELPAQWTDIYNFIFRRRMVFLMQYLDDELCNQICGLLINIHMEDRSKELEKKEMDKSVFKSTTKQTASKTSTQKGSEPSSRAGTTEAIYNKKSRSVEDLLNADEDLGIEEIDTLEQYTLQKITTEWLNWNAQFFDYSDEPYLFYLAELLSKDFNNSEARMGNLGPKGKPANENNEIGQLLQMLKATGVSNNGKAENFAAGAFGDIYAPFRKHAKFSASDYSLKDLSTLSGKEKLLHMFKERYSSRQDASAGASRNGSASGAAPLQAKDKAIYKLLSDLAQKDFHSATNHASDKALGQRKLRQEYNLDKNFKRNKYSNDGFAMAPDSLKSFSYLDLPGAGNEGYSEFRDYYRKQTERALIEEESKKVFVIINSFGGSVGNGITVHDALQFIKAGSLTLALGVAASAASLVLAGGTIGERYVTEGCHTMIHQPEGGLQGQASDIWIDSQEIMKIRLDVAEIYSLSTYRPRHKILRDLDRDFYLTASETIHYGLADEIATNEVMHDIIEMTSKVWDYHDSKQQRLLESRESASAGMDTQTQN
uniref:ATP-dependent Clp protease proteolytic subunit n=1 Tax=Chlamydomonas leiostraca TaxID=1034604 RepID=A0A1L2M546_9CHLO|nr:ATP-dependent Clp protease proteolytic subunit [Chlamydomonas leiostraca]APD80589.1 ATP-dependent Clp protease proteolytic subunit [Chlamydomonas leiostraca]